MNVRWARRCRVHVPRVCNPLYEGKSSSIGLVITLIAMAFIALGCEKTASRADAEAHPSVNALAQSLSTQPASQPVPSVTMAVSVDVRQLVTSYHQLQRMTPDSVSVQPASLLLADCRGPTSKEIEQATAKYGPHALMSINVYMNAAAAEAFKQTKPAYPVGSMVVKEKKVTYGNTSPPTPGLAHSDGVGGMIKRPPGYDPKHGDWEYVYAEQPGKLENGRLSNCIDCHQNASSKGYVFGNWAKPFNDASIRVE